MTTIFMVFTCAFLNGAPYNFHERDGQNAIQPNGSTMERRISFPL
jgi:hypothetical protein